MGRDDATRAELRRATGAYGCEAPQCVELHRAPPSSRSVMRKGCGASVHRAVNCTAVLRQKEVIFTVYANGSHVGHYAAERDPTRRRC